MKDLKSIKEPIRLATHNADLDGIGSAALFIRACKKINRSYSIKYMSVDDAKISDLELDFVTDLPKIKNAINIDHHQSNFENLLKEEKITDEDRIKPKEPSAAKIVYNYLHNNYFSNDKIAEEIEQISTLSDQGKIPKFFRKIDILIKNYPNQHEKLLKISELFAEKGASLSTDNWIEDEYKKISITFENSKHVLRNYFEKKKKEIPDILVLDVVNAIDQKFSKEAIFYAFSNGIKVLAILSYREQSNKYSVSFRVENSVQSLVDVGKVAENLGGGGHKMASAARGINRKLFREKVEIELKVLSEKLDYSLKTFIIKE